MSFFDDLLNTVKGIPGGIAHGIASTAGAVVGAGIDAGYNLPRNIFDTGAALVGAATGNQVAEQNAQEASNRAFQGSSFFKHSLQPIQDVQNPGDLVQLVKGTGSALAGAAETYGPIATLPLGAGEIAGATGLGAKVGAGALAGAEQGSFFGALNPVSQGDYNPTDIARNSIMGGITGGIVGGVTPLGIEGIKSGINTVGSANSALGEGGYITLGNPENELPTTKETLANDSAPQPNKSVNTDNPSGADAAMAALQGQKPQATVTDATGNTYEALSQRLQGSAEQGRLDFQVNDKPGLIQNLVARMKGEAPSDVNFRDTGKSIDQNYAGIRGGQEIAGQQVAQQINRLVPGATDQAAIELATAYKNDPAAIRSEIANPDLAGKTVDVTINGKTTSVPVQDVIARALDVADGNIPQAMKDAQAMRNDFYVKTGQTAQDAGAISSLRDSYYKGMYSKEEGTTSAFSRDQTLRQTTSAGESKSYQNPIEALVDGKTPELGSGHLLDSYNRDFATVLPNRLAENGIVKEGLGQRVDPASVPKGWTAIEGTERNTPQLDNTGHPVLDDSGNEVSSKTVLAVPNQLATYIRPLTDPNFFNKIDLLKQGADINAVTKVGKLGLSAYHWSNELKVALGQAVSKGGLDLPSLVKTLQNDDMSSMQRLAADHNVILHSSTDSLEGVFSKLQENEGVLGKVANLPGVKQFGTVSDLAENALFGKLIPYMKTVDFNTKAQDWLAGHPNAAQGELNAALDSLGREVNSSYGGINWTALGKSPSAVSLGKFAALAYDWTYSNYDLIKQASFATGNTVGARRAAGAVVGGLIVGHLAGDALNTILTGHAMSQNASGHENEISLGGSVYVSPFAADIADPLKLARDIQGKGAVTGTGQFLMGKTSPLLQVAIGLLKNDQGNGRNIATAGNGFFANTLADGKFIANQLSPVPIGIGGINNSQGAPLPARIAAATGLATASAPPSTSSSSGFSSSATTPGNSSLSTGTSPTVGGSTSLGSPSATTRSRVTSARTPKRASVRGIRKGSSRRSSGGRSRGAHLSSSAGRTRAHRPSKSVAVRTK